MPLLSADALHSRALKNKPIERPAEELSLFKTVVGYINTSTGNAKTSALLCGVYTSEYVIIPVPAGMTIVDTTQGQETSDADKVIQYLRNHNYFATLRSDSLKRFREESLLIVCWDPRVIAAYEDGIDPDAAALNECGMCILPGQDSKPCVRCYECIVYFSKKSDGVTETADANNGIEGLNPEA